MEVQAEEPTEWDWEGEDVQNEHWELNKQQIRCWGEKNVISSRERRGQCIVACVYPMPVRARASVLIWKTAL